MRESEGTDIDTVFCRMTTARNVCFTLNNYTEAEYKAILEWDCKYLIVAKEVGESKTPHLQGYVEWKSPKRFETMKNLNKRIHWEKRRGTAKQAADYCKKEGDFVEKGAMSKQGERNDIHDFVDALKSGKRMRDAAEDNPVTFIKYHKGLKAYQSLMMKDREEMPYIEWRYGEAGAGKTYGVKAKHGQENIYMYDLKWWDQYEGEKVILIDDIDPSEWKKETYKAFLRLCDENKFQDQYKGGYVKVNSPYIYITAEKHPADYWTGNELKQIVRRMAKIVCMVDREEKESYLEGGSGVPYPGDLKTAAPPATSAPPAEEEDLDEKHVEEPPMQPDPVAEPAAYPEGHPEVPYTQVHMLHMLQKLAGNTNGQLVLQADTEIVDLTQDDEPPRKKWCPPKKAFKNPFLEEEAECSDEEDEDEDEEPHTSDDEFIDDSR